MSLLVAKDSDDSLYLCVLVLSPALKKSQSEADVMKKQMEGLSREYDRLLKEHQELQVMLRLKTFQKNGSGHSLPDNVRLTFKLISIKVVLILAEDNKSQTFQGETERKHVKNLTT